MKPVELDNDDFIKFLCNEKQDVLDSGISYERVAINEIKEVSVLIEKVFNEFIAGEYSKEGRQNFLNYVSTENIKNRLKKENNFMVVAKKNNKIVGVIEMRDKNHLSLLFVNRNYQRRGIATNLFYIAKELCERIDDNLEKISVNSSPFALKFYNRLGFKQTEEVQEKIGIRYIPMKYDLKS